MQKQQVKQEEYVEIMVPLKYLINYWRTLEMSIINCVNNLDINWSKKSVIVDTPVANQGETCLMIDTKLYVPVLMLSTQDSEKLLEKLKSGFKRTINWNKDQSKLSTEIPKQYLYYIVDPSFERVNKLFWR